MEYFTLKDIKSLCGIKGHTLRAEAALQPSICHKVICQFILSNKLAPTVHEKRALLI